MPFRFYPVNLILVGLILLPNLIFLVVPPQHIPDQSSRSSGWLIVSILERVGQISCFALPLFWKFDLKFANKAILVLMAIALLIYYIGWSRYLLGDHSFKLLFSPMWKLPIPLAIAPVVYFLCIGILQNSWPVIIASIVFAAGHIPESWQSYSASIGF